MRKNWLRKSYFPCFSLAHPLVLIRPEGSIESDALLFTVLFQLSDMVLGVKLKAELGDQIELGLQKVDVLLFIVHQLFEQVAGDVVLDTVAVRRRFLVERARRHFRRKIAVKHLLDVTPD